MEDGVTNAFRLFASKGSGDPGGGSVAGPRRSQMPFGCLRVKDNYKQAAGIAQRAISSQMPFGCLRVKDIIPFLNASAWCPRHKCLSAVCEQRIRVDDVNNLLKTHVTNAFRLFASKGWLRLSKWNRGSRISSQMPFGCLRAKDPRIVYGSREQLCHVTNAFRLFASKGFNILI